MEKPPRGVEGVGCLVSLVQNQRGHARPAQEKLDENRVYLDNCLSLHQVFTKKHLRGVKINMMHLKGYFNAGTNYSKRKVLWLGFHMYIVDSGIAKLLSVPQLEADDFNID